MTNTQQIVITVFLLCFQDLLSHSYRALVLHGGVDQIDRDSTILDFKAGRVPIMVATSVAARGLDVKQLILVVNFDCPNHYEDYVHRYAIFLCVCNCMCVFVFI